MKKKFLKLLYRSFDEALSEKDQEFLNAALEDSEELRREKERAAAQRKAITETASPSFKPFFAERVVNKIHSFGYQSGQESFYESLKILFRRFALVGAALLIALTLYNMQRGDILSSDEMLFAADAAIEEIIDLPLF
jgi:hypothetical protein